MSTIEFEYRREQSAILGYIYRPIAKVQIQRIRDKKLISEYMYVDRLGRFLGYKHSRDENIHEVQGVNGIVPVIFKITKMKIGEYQFQARIAWAQIEEAPLLLGRLDVFEHFDITFKQNKKMVLFEWTGGNSV
ncbi:MAG: hypothetical protein ACE5KE_03260 [Methanosarcinales archaeon]